MAKESSVKRLNLELNEDQEKKVEELKTITNQTKAGVLRYALSLLYIIAGKTKEGYTMQLKKGNKTIELVLPFF